MKNSWLWQAPFPLALAAFAGIGVRYFDFVFTTNTRWAFLALLAGILALKGRIFSALRSGFGLPLVAYFSWCAATTAWSQVPELSFLKSMAMIVTALAFFSGGYYWVINSRPEKTFTYLLPVVFLAVLAGLGGTSSNMSQGITLYKGLAGNPNQLGIMIALALPYALYFGYRAIFRRNAGAYSEALSVGLIGVLGLLLWRTGSRASMLCALSTIFFTVKSLTANKKAVIALILGFGVVGTAVILPRLQASLYERFVVKGTGDNGVFFSRYTPWEESYKAALQGGDLGAGYGVSVGDTNFSFGLTANTYGREKGNSQLAVWEETGLVGLTLYALLLFGIFKRLYKGIRASPSGELKVMLGLAFGLALGLTAQSAFEAWWTSPGSLESAAFWSIVGVGTALVKRAMMSRPRGARVVRAAGLPVALERARGWPRAPF